MLGVTFFFFNTQLSKLQRVLRHLAALPHSNKDRGITGRGSSDSVGLRLSCPRCNGARSAPPKRPSRGTPPTAANRPCCGRWPLLAAGQPGAPAPLAQPSPSALRVARRMSQELEMRGQKGVLRAGSPHDGASPAAAFDRRHLIKDGRSYTYSHRRRKRNQPPSTVGGRRCTAAVGAS